MDPRRKGEKICGLCNTEKTLIAAGDPAILLNKRSEIMERCRHRDSLVLTNNVRSGRSTRRNFRYEDTTVASSSPGSSSGVLPVPVLEEGNNEDIFEHSPSSPAVLPVTVGDNVDTREPSSSSVSSAVILTDTANRSNITSSSPGNSEEDPAYPSSSLPPVNNEDRQLHIMRNLDRIDYRRFF